MRKIVHFLKNMKGRTWFWVVFVLFFVFQFALFPEMLKLHYVYAEDGGIFIDGFQRDGIGSLFQPYGGYMVMTSRLFAMISVTVGRTVNNFSGVIEMMEIISTAFIALIMAYFASDRFEFLIKKRSRRLIVGLLTIVMMSMFVGMLFGGVGIHWWCGLLMLFVNFELLSGKLPPVWLYPFICISILSSPSALILGFGLAYYFIKKVFVEKKAKELKNTKTIVFFALSLICLAVQAFVILFVTNVAGGTKAGISVRRVINTSSASYDLAVSSSLFMFTVNAFKYLFINKIAVVIGGLLWVVILYLAKKKKVLRYALMGLGCIFFMYFMMFFKRDGGGWPIAGEGGVYHWITTICSDNFYNAIPATISMIVFAMVGLQYAKKQHLFVEVALLIAMVPHLVIDRWRPPYDNFNSTNVALYNGINKNLQFGSDSYAVYRYDFHSYDVIHIPVNPEYCKNEWVVCEAL